MVNRYYSNTSDVVFPKGILQANDLASVWGQHGDFMRSVTLFQKVVAERAQEACFVQIRWTSKFFIVRFWVLMGNKVQIVLHSLYVTQIKNGVMILEVGIDVGMDRKHVC